MQISLEYIIQYSFPPTRVYITETNFQDASLFREETDKELPIADFPLFIRDRCAAGKHRKLLYRLTVCKGATNIYSETADEAKRSLNKKKTKNHISPYSRRELEKISFARALELFSAPRFKILEKPSWRARADVGCIKRKGRKKKSMHAPAATPRTVCTWTKFSDFRISV